MRFVANLDVSLIFKALLQHSNIFVSAVPLVGLGKDEGRLLVIA
jgi:hypothetical protein